MSLTTTEKLAIHGGSPLAPGLQGPVWPPRNEATAERLKEIYFGGSWSFAGDEEMAFAAEFAEYHGAKYGIFMANGTVTLQCSLQAYRIGPGDEVIVPAFTWIATAMAVLEVGATPVVVDVEPTTLCIDPELIEAAITPCTKAIIPVHLFGGMANLDAVLDIAERHNLIVIEDCAHAHGGQWKDRSLGSWGNVGSFSFQQSKTMASGEGGICITNDADIAARLYRLKHIGYGPATQQGKANAGPDPDLLCHNYRATEFQAAILRDQLKDLPRRMQNYQTNAARLEEILADVPGIRIQSRGLEATVQSYYCWCIVTEGELAEVPLGDVEKALVAEGMKIGGTYGPIYNHILWNVAPDKFRIHGGSCPVTEITGMQHTLAMPHYWLDSDPETIEKVGAVITKVANQAEALRAAAASPVA